MDHITHCPGAQLSLPSCGLLGHSCSLSCLVLWFPHLRLCQKCVNHIAMGTCQDVHCKRIVYLWILRSNIIEILCIRKLKPDGEIFTSVVRDIQSLLRLDYQNIKYEKINDTSPINWTVMVFQILNVLCSFQKEMKALGMQLEGIDLSYIFTYLAEKELVDYFSDT